VFGSVGKLFGRSEATVVADALQGLAATVIASSGTYGEILNFEVRVDFSFFAMTEQRCSFYDWSDQVDTAPYCVPDIRHHN
jgi:hypothetical protein